MLSALPNKILNRFSKQFLSPDNLFTALNVGPGQHILEIGLPVGFFAPTALGYVGQDGRVYVAGPDNESLEKLSYLSDKKSLHLLLLSDVLAGKSIPDHSVDVVILTNLLSNSVHPDNYCLSLDRYLKPDSEIILIEWDVSDTAVGPAQKQRVSREQAIRLFSQCGFEFIRVLQTPGYHYGLVFKSTDRDATIGTS